MDACYIHMFVVVSLGCLIFVQVHAEEFPTFSDSFVMKADIPYSEAESIANRYGFELKEQLFGKYFVMKKRDLLTRSAVKSKWKSRGLLKRHPQVEYVVQEQFVPKHGTSVPENNIRRRRQVDTFTDPTDELWKDGSQWYMMKGERMRMYEAWKNTKYDGTGVIIAIVDDGVETTHTDLSGKYLSRLSYDYLDNDKDPSHTDDDSHGTNCASIAIAEKDNDKCIAGIAYGAKFAALKINDAHRSTKYSDDVHVLTDNSKEIGIYSNSWGLPTKGTSFAGPSVDDKGSEMVIEALKDGTENGRNGKGSIYLWASGNDGKLHEDCNVDGYVNSIYAMAINSAAKDGSPATYAQTCSAVFASTYGGDSEKGPNDPVIATATVGNKCSVGFEGTSAATPVAAGIIALVLEANPDLTWRDVFHLVVETSINTGIQGDFKENDEGKRVSLFHGFGMLNAEALITKALTWKNVPERKSYSSSKQSPNSQSTGNVIEESMEVETSILCLEHVQVWIEYKASVRGNVELYITSPKGTSSRLLRRRPLDFNNKRTKWTFMTVHAWGEDPNGEWTLKLKDAVSKTKMALYSWRLHLYGTERSLFCRPIHADGFDCTFEDGGSCGWKLGSKNQFHVAIKKGPSDPSGLTGPSDSRVKRSNDHYLFADASDNANKFAKVTSPYFTNKQYCFEFQYHMFGRDVGSLILKLLLGPKASTIWSKSGSQSKSWLSQRLSLKPTLAYNGTMQLEFDFKMGPNYQGDIAVDNVSLKPGKCLH